MAEPRSTFPSFQDHVDSLTVKVFQPWHSTQWTRRDLAYARRYSELWGQQYPGKGEDELQRLQAALFDAYRYVGRFEYAVTGSRWVVDNPDGTVSAAAHKPNCLHCWCRLSGSKRKCCECGAVAP